MTAVMISILSFSDFYRLYHLFLEFVAYIFLILVGSLSYFWDSQPMFFLIWQDIIAVSLIFGLHECYGFFSIWDISSIWGLVQKLMRRPAYKQRQGIIPMPPQQSVQVH